MGEGRFSAEISEPDLCTHQYADSSHTLSALRLSSGSPTRFHLKPTRHNSFQSCSAASLRWCTRVLRSGSSLAFGKPVSTEGSGLGASYSRTGGRTWSAAWSLVVYLTPSIHWFGLRCWSVGKTSKPLKRPFRSVQLSWCWN